MGGIMVTGASGLVGFRLVEVLGKEEPVIALYCTKKPDTPFGCWYQLDLQSRSATRKLLDELRPSVIVHCAAYSDPVFCENHPLEATAVNFGATLYLAEWASENKAHLFLLSTDLVFDGSYGDYREEDDPHPISIYGWTKLAAEMAVKSSLASWTIIRTSLVYGRSAWRDRGADEKLIIAWKRRKQTSLFVDEYRNPTAVGELALAVSELVHRRLTGIWHVGGMEVVSRYQFGKKVASLLNHPRELLVPKRIDEVKTIPPRAPNTVLCIDKVKTHLDLSFKSIDSNLRLEHE